MLRITNAYFHSILECIRGFEWVRGGLARWAFTPSFVLGLNAYQKSQ